MTPPDMSVFADLTDAQRTALVRAIHRIGGEMHDQLDRATDEATREAIRDAARKRVIVELVRLRLVAKAARN